MVPIRDANGNDLPGVTTSDCEYKAAYPASTTVALCSTTSGSRGRTC